ncbi:hypothetical protein BT63DRAFT_449431 [Microthyrium microscopicum]|uniref:Uncharacterized protein n=1 Tax=Microthyrium microscopicum TaxID=703497 RepID=A0A6A6URR1_9PEZI|nr:hypothetical protein BT63DRAFT_449431 [Microthyrium microscopicum]
MATNSPARNIDRTNGTGTGQTPDDVNTQHEHQQPSEDGTEPPWIDSDDHSQDNEPISSESSMVDSDDMSGQAGESDGLARYEHLQEDPWTPEILQASTEDNSRAGFGQFPHFQWNNFASESRPNGIVSRANFEEAEAEDGEEQESNGVDDEESYSD